MAVETHAYINVNLCSVFGQLLFEVPCILLKTFLLNSLISADLEIPVKHLLQQYDCKLIADITL